MKHLLIMRHAKSSWSDTDLPDSDRPLNQRGRLASVLMGRWIDELDIDPDHVLLSPARRVQETWENVDHLLSQRERKVTTLGNMYMAGPDELMDHIRALPNSCETALLIAHQPGLSALVRRLTGGTASSACSRSFAKFPTAAVARLKLDVADWSSLRAGGANYKSFACPKELV